MHHEVEMRKVHGRHEVLYTEFPVIFIIHFISF